MLPPTGQTSCLRDSSQRKILILAKLCWVSRFNTHSLTEVATDFKVRLGYGKAAGQLSMTCQSVRTVSHRDSGQLRRTPAEPCA